MQPDRVYASETNPERLEMRCWLVPLMAAALLVGCVPRSVDSELLARSAQGGGRKSIGVISAIGQKLGVKKVGITVFGNEYTDVPIDSWQIDDHVSQKVSAILAKRYDARRIAMPKDVLAAYEKPAPLFGDSPPRLKEIMQRISATEKCDFYVIPIRLAQAGAS